MKKLVELEKVIGYKFKNTELLKMALTHTSYAYENNVKSYERLEFLGDSILEFVCSEYLFENYNHLSEGEMTKVRAYAVCEDNLFSVAKKHNIKGNTNSYEIGLKVSSTGLILPEGATTVFTTK